MSSRSPAALRAAAALTALALLAPLPALADCKVAKIAELPVTLIGRRAIIDAKFGDHPARFIVDSGAFYSTLSRASATKYGLTMEPMPDWFRLRGINGDSSASYANARDFSLAGVALSKVDFIVGGSDTGTTGLLGQNILGIADTEYDLPHGAVRLMHVQGCSRVGLAYWTQGKPFSTVALEHGAGGPWKPHTIGTIIINGVKMRAVFDSGAQTTIMTLAAAKRAGVTPDTPGVVREGYYTGLGARQLPTWVATFDKIDLGGEILSHPQIRFADMQIDGDLLVGFDFFLTHRLFVSNANHQIYLTYEGGPLFGLTPTGARTVAGERIAIGDQTSEPTDANGYARRAAVLMSLHRIADGLADLDKAVALAPDDGRLLYLRAQGRLANGQPLLAAADLDKAVTLLPADSDIRLARARLRLEARDPDGAAADVKAADAALPPESGHRLQLAGLYEQLERPEAALVNYDAWMKLHRDDADRAQALNGRCWARALLNRDLGRALSDCNAALKMRPGFASYLDSRALVALRQGRFADALVDYDAAIAAAPRNAWSHYGRGVAEARLGKAEAAAADLVLARTINARAVDRARRYGVMP
jgi:predicted aspartyl protease